MVFFLITLHTDKERAKKLAGSPYKEKSSELYSTNHRVLEDKGCPQSTNPDTRVITIGFWIKDDVETRC